jgi:hypothetical protein
MAVSPTRTRLRSARGASHPGKARGQPAPGGAPWRPPVDDVRWKTPKLADSGRTPVSATEVTADPFTAGGDPPERVGDVLAFYAAVRTD